VAKVRFAPGTADFRALHAVTPVGFAVDVLFGCRFPEARPARAGIELGLGTKEGGAAADATEHSLLVQVPVLAGESALGPLLARHFILFRSEELLPLGIGLNYLFRSHDSLPVIGYIEIHPPDEFLRKLAGRAAGGFVSSSGAPQKICFSPI
jgi:hypothetical protein